MTRLRGLLALLVLVAVVAGVPWGLARFGDWPLDGIPTAEQVGDLTDTLVSDATVFAVLTLAAWLVWGLFMVSLLVEAAAAARGVRAPRVALAGPLQRSASTLVAAVVLAVTINHPVPSASAAAQPAAPTELPPPSDPHTPETTGHRHQSAPPPAPPTPPTATSPLPASPPTAQGEEPVVVVRPGDTPWSIAETHLGDGMAWRTLWDLNRDRPQPDGRTWRDPQLIRPGWHLRLPSPPPQTAPDLHVVEPGDTLSGIAADHLGDPDRYPDIFAANTGVPQPDGRRLTDPDLILPGWRLTLPTPPDGRTVQHDPAPEPDPPSAPTADSAEAPPPEPLPPATDDVPPPDGAAPPTAPPATPVPTPPSPDIDALPEPGAPGRSDLLPTIAGLTGAVVLASGLAAQVHRLRRRRAARSATLTRALPEPLRHTETAVTAAADVALTTWAGHAIARLVASLDPRAITATPVAVELSDTAGVELLWTHPQPGARAPWQEADGGWAWRLPYDPDQPVPADALPAGIPALVTIGSRDGRQLLVDLEAYGTIGVAGDPTRVDGFLRAVAVELATSTDLADAYVHTAGLTIDPAPFDRLAASTPGHAAEHLSATRASVSQALERARAATTFAARAGSSTPIEATIAIAVPSDHDQAQQLIDTTSPGRGVALIIATDAPTPARIELPAEGPARIEPLGVAFDPVCLPAESAEDITRLLEALHDLDEPPGPFPATDPPPGRDPSTDAHPAGADHPPTDREKPEPFVDEPQLFPTAAPAPHDPPALVVRVLGVPSVPDRPGLGRRELIVTALLACRAGPVPASAVQDALWGGKPVEPKTVWNLIGATRTALGELADGTPLLPAADRVHQTLRLAPGVTTDLALLRTLVQRANHAPSSEAVGLLRDALALVEGPPFDAPGFDWAHRDQDVAEASTLMVQAAEHLVEVALDTGQLDVARDAVVRALRGLPGNEELYRLRMRVEHHAGNLPGVAAAYDELVTFLLDLDTEPSPATTALYRELLPSPSRR